MTEKYHDSPLTYLGSAYGPGVLIPAKGAAGTTNHAEAFANALLRIVDAITPATSLELYKDDVTATLTAGVRAGSYYDGPTLVAYAASTGFALTDDATNYVYLTAAGVLTKSVVSFPASAHIPLAEVKTGSASVAAVSGGYDLVDITDRRNRAIFSTVNASPAAGRFEMLEDFNADAGATLPTPWLTDAHATGTADYVADAMAGQFQLSLTAANAAEAAQLTWGDHRTIDTDLDPIVEFRVRIDGVASMTAVERVAIGLVADHATAEAALDNIDHSVWFLIKGAADLNIYMEADDGSTDTDDTDTGINLVDDTWTVFRIDMSNLAAVVMSVDGVAAGATLDMTDSAAQVLQPIVVIQRDSDAGAEAVIDVEIDLISVSADR